MRTRRPYVRALADPDHVTQPEGIAVVASYQSSPITDVPFKVRGIIPGSQLRRKVDVIVDVALTRAQAAKLVSDFSSFMGDPLNNGRPVSRRVEHGRIAQHFADVVPGHAPTPIREVIAMVGDERGKPYASTFEMQGSDGAEYRVTVERKA